MTKYNTGNPVGSADPRDLYDTATVADKLVQGEDAAYPDRLGVPRRSWKSVEDQADQQAVEFDADQVDRAQRFNDFLTSSGYVGTGVNGTVENYSAGIEITEYNQIVRDSFGELWRLSGSTNLPYTTTGAGLPEGGAFVAVGDAVLRQELASSTTAQGSDLIAHTGTSDTVTEALGKNAAEIERRVIYVGSVAELEALSLPVGTAVYLTEDGRAGEFVVKAGTPPADTYKGFYIPITGGNYAERADKTVAIPEMFGAATDWNGTAGTDIHDIVQAMLDMPEVKIIQGTGSPYYFGTVPVDATQILVTRDVAIDWGGSLLVCACDNSQAGTDANLFTFQDCRMNMRNYEFLDVNFDLLSGPSRGVAPAILKAATKTTAGHSLTGFNVIRGQSLLTCTSSAPNLYRSSGVEISGVGGDVYYGLNCANNGDSVRGGYSVDSCNRLSFVYGCQDVKLVTRCKTGAPSSANLLISSSGTGFPATKDIDIVAHFDEINGPIGILDQPVSDGSGDYKNISLHITFESLGSNINAGVPIVRLGAYDTLGAPFTTEKTIKADMISITLIKGDSVPILDVPINVYTPSPNYGELSVGGNCGITYASAFPKNASELALGYTLKVDGRREAGYRGDLTGANAYCTLPSRYLAVDQKNTGVINEVYIRAFGNVGGQVTYAKYSIIGVLSSTGTFSLTSATEIFRRSTGGTTPIITLTAAPDGSGLRASIDTYSNQFAYIVCGVLT